MRRRSTPTKHPIAILRQILGIPQAELARICGCSTRAVQSIELRTLQLSEGLAGRIEKETGADLSWLLGGDPNTEPRFSETMLRREPSSKGMPYTKETYDRFRAQIESDAAGESARSERLPYLELASFPAILKNAEDKGQGTLARYRLRQFELSFKKEFGTDDDEEQRFFEKLMAIVHAEQEWNARPALKNAAHHELKRWEAEVEASVTKARKEGREPTADEREPAHLLWLRLFLQLANVNEEEVRAPSPKAKTRKPKLRQ